MDQLVFILPMNLLHVESVVDVTKSSVSSKLIFELKLGIKGGSLLALNCGVGNLG